MTTEQDKTYNGWTNYETWLVNIHISNDEADMRQFQRLAKQCYDSAEDSTSNYAQFTGREIFTREERATLELEKIIKNTTEEAAPELDGIFGDLLNSALDEVNWHEIAEHLIDELRENE